jgi:hypothetical protein
MKMVFIFIFRARELPVSGRNCSCELKLFQNQPGFGTTSIFNLGAFAAFYAANRAIRSNSLSPLAGACGISASIPCA